MRRRASVEVTGYCSAKPCGAPVLGERGFRIVSGGLRNRARQVFRFCSEHEGEWSSDWRLLSEGEREAAVSALRAVVGWWLG